MKLVEFKAWFEGFTESLDIDGVAITERVYVGRYWPSRGYPYWSTCSSGATGHSLLLSAGQIAAQSPNTFDGAVAMYAAGKSEAHEFAG